MEAALGEGPILARRVLVLVLEEVPAAKVQGPVLEVVQEARVLVPVVVQEAKDQVLAPVRDLADKVAVAD